MYCLHNFDTVFCFLFSRKITNMHKYNRSIMCNFAEKINVCTKYAQIYCNNA